MAEYQFNVVVNPNSSEETSFTVKRMIDVFSINMSEISNFALSLGGSVVNDTTVIVPSETALIAMANKLLLLTIPIRFSRKMNKR